MELDIKKPHTAQGVEGCFFENLKNEHDTPYLTDKVKYCLNPSNRRQLTGHHSLRNSMNSIEQTDPYPLLKKIKVLINIQKTVAHNFNNFSEDQLFHRKQSC